MAQMTMKSVTLFANSLITSLFIIVFGFSNPAKAADVNPLRPVNESNPRATLQGFRHRSDRERAARRRLAGFRRYGRPTPRLLEQVKNLPYKPGPAKQAADAYRALSSNRTTTIYEAFTISPLGLEAIIPTRWMLSLPVWAKAQIAGVTLWQWFGFVFGFLVGLLFVFGVYRLARRLARRREDGAAPGWHSLLIPLAIILLAGVLGPLICKILRIGGSPLVVIAFVQTITLYVSAAWISTEPNRFARLSRAARATARPPTPRPASIE
jgi:hypothetical protein